MKCFKVPKGRGGTKINKNKNTHFFSFGRKKEEEKEQLLNNNAKLYHCKILIKFSCKGD